jgi:hypothetical protein
MEPTVGQMVDDLSLQQRFLEQMINEEPTGEVRNQLCDANIHLMLAIDTLKLVK